MATTAFRAGIGLAERGPALALAFSVWPVDALRRTVAVVLGAHSGRSGGA
jgi:hypothetical protein